MLFQIAVDTTDRVSNMRALAVEARDKRTRGLPLSRCLKLGRRLTEIEFERLTKVKGPIYSRVPLGPAP